MFTASVEDLQYVVIVKNHGTTQLPGSDAGTVPTEDGNSSNGADTMRVTSGITGTDLLIFGVIAILLVAGVALNITVIKRKQGRR